MDPSCEYLVGAMFRPSLREAFQFCVCWGRGGEAKLLPSSPYILIPVVRLYRLHFLQIQCEKALFANGEKLLIRYFEINYRRPDIWQCWHFWKVELRPCPPFALFAE